MRSVRRRARAWSHSIMAVIAARIALTIASHPPSTAPGCATPRRCTRTTKTPLSAPAFVVSVRPKRPIPSVRGNGARYPHPPPPPPPPPPHQPPPPNHPTPDHTTISNPPHP